MADPGKESTNNIVSGTINGSLIQARDIYGNFLLADRALPIPRQLPADINNFVGRMDELALMDHALRLEHRSRVILIDGAPGVGKTALGVRWSHSVSGIFPDGQLFADMHSFDSEMEKIDAREVLDQFLRGLDVPERKIPGSLEGRSALFRSVIADRRVLIVIDNAAEARDIRPIIPAGHNSLIVITSRTTIPELGALGDGESIRLGPLSFAESFLLISERVGPAVSNAFPNEIREVITIAGSLPLALRIVGQRLRLAGQSAVIGTVESLATSARTLDEFRVGRDPAADMRSVIKWSYDALPEHAAHLFRMSGLHMGSTVSLGALEALSGLSSEACLTAATVLIEANLMDHDGLGRYRQHDLLRAFSRDLLDHEEESAERVSALRNMLVWYAFSVDAADRALEPQRRHIDLTEYKFRGSLPSFKNHLDALSWCDAERKNIVAAARVASDIGLYDISWKIAISFWSYLDMRKHWDDWINIHLTGASSARAAKDRYGEAWVLNGLGIAYFELRQYPDAVAAWQDAISLRRQIADNVGAGWTINNLGNLWFETGEMQAAKECWAEAIGLFRDTGHRQGEALAISNIGRVDAREQRLAEAISCQQRAIEIFRGIDDRRNQGFALNNLAEAFSLSGETDLAILNYREALAIRRDVQDRRGIARTLHGLGIAFIQAGKIEASADSLIESGRLFEDLADPAARDVRELLAGISANTLNREDAMDPVTIEVLIAAVSAAAAGAATEVGRSTWTSLTSLVKKAFGSHSAEALLLEQALDAPADPRFVVPLAAGLIARSKDDSEIAEDLSSFLGLLRTSAPEGVSTFNSVSGSAVIHGGLVQGHDFSGPISFSAGTEAADSPSPQRQIRKSDDC
jgi:tetratricopeptide (TPR) repeat protein